MASYMASVTVEFTRWLHGDAEGSSGCYTDEDGLVVASLAANSHYLIRTQPVAGLDLGSARLAHPLAMDRLYPVTLVHTDQSANFQAKIAEFKKDGEFDQDHFLNVVILLDRHDRTTSSPTYTHPRSVGCKYISVASSCNSTVCPEGPYFARGRSLFPTWRLYPDIYEAFQLPTIYDANTNEFRGINIMRDGHLMIPVPSRLHYPKIATKPLNGVRVTVKDIIHMRGVKTTGQSRSYEKLYGPREETALIIRRLVDLGAVIVGKTKCTQFASSDQPTADWIDYHCPWNPRGDLYLSPRGSSTGTCVALAGYNWVDLGIGSDSKKHVLYASTFTAADLWLIHQPCVPAGGSIRGPAGVMGLYAIRPTHSHQHLHGIMPLVQDMDTPGLACRDAELFHQVTCHLFGPKKPNNITEDNGQATKNPLESPVLHKCPPETHSPRRWRDSLAGLFILRSLLATRPSGASPPQPSTQLRLTSPVTTQLPSLWRKPTKLVYPKDYWNQWDGNPAKPLMEAAVTQLEEYLGIKKTEMTLEEKWLESKPAGTSEPLQTYLQDTFMTLLWKGYYDNFQEFRDEYQKKYGAPPYVHPVIQECWRRGEQVSPEDLEKAKARKANYSTWLRKHILSDGENSDFDTIMVYPVGDFAPFYRDVYRNDPRDQIPSYNWAEREDHQSSLSGVPSVVLSVGQIPQPSKVTGQSQELPVAISLISGAGTDTQLTALLVDLTRKRRFKGEVKVGTHAF